METSTPTMIFADPTKPLPVTYLFKTREGSIGILQMVGFVTNKPPGQPVGIKIRYMLLADGAAP